MENLENGLNKLNFYEINEDYVKFLHNVEGKVPNIEYAKHNKFLCGVVLNINDKCYFAPISHDTKQLKTNFVIKETDRFDKNKINPISSIKFSFMFPANYEVLKIKDFSHEDPKYCRLLQKELSYCNEHLSEIYVKAFEVYNIGISKTNPLHKVCCNFKKLENTCNEFTRTLNEEIAATLDSTNDKSFLRAKITKLYKNELPEVKYISYDTVEKLDKLNKEYHHTLSKKELKDFCTYYGKILEVDPDNQTASVNFKKFKSIIDDFKHAQLTEQNNLLHNKISQTQQHSEVKNPDLER